MKDNKFRLMKAFALSLLLACYGCTPINGLTAGDQDDFFLVFQFKYLDDNGKYINVEDSRFDDLRAYGRTDFVTKSSITGLSLKYCEIQNRQPVIFGLARHIEYSDKWRYLVFEPYLYYRKHSEAIPNQRQVFVIEIPRRPAIRSWSSWKKPDYIGDLFETSFVLSGNHTEYLSKLEGPPYFELRYRVVTGTMSGGILAVREKK